MRTRRLPMPPTTCMPIASLLTAPHTSPRTVRMMGRTTLVAACCISYRWVCWGTG
ncbi:hypothetical protein E2C01_091409 [Portunus trituberculatus]|uniref:Uncharacterized protein n=1 Tax=Portunus trituberculatus TaxID=210409 RepID=A0A5B7JST8_PORTR|nr:hypothetical protein [Portunus trituberculatus]